MSTKLQIWNKALTLLGDKRISGLTENSVLRRDIESVYEEDKRSLLEQGTWKFARKEATLNLNITVPNGFSRAFELPADFLKLVYLNNTNPAQRDTPYFGIVGQELQTDETSAKITYIYNVTQEGLFSPTFTNSLSIQLALSLAFARTQSQPLIDRLEDKLERSLSKARKADSMGERSHPVTPYAYPNVLARYKGIYGSSTSDFFQT